MQLLSYLIAVGSLIPSTLAIATCPTPTTCKGLSGTVATAIKSYAPAKTFCSSKYPVPQKTCTSVAPAVVLTSTVATSTAISTVAITTVTAQAAPFTSTFTDTTTPIVTSTQTSIITETTTYTSSTTVRVGAKPVVITACAVDPRSSQLSSLIKSQASSFVGAVCTCIETPASITVTSTPTSVSSVTATLISKVTASSTTTVTLTSSTTLTVTAEPTTTIKIETRTKISTAATTATETVRVTGFLQCSYYGSASDEQKECTNGCLCDSIAEGNEAGKAYCYMPPFIFGPGSCVSSSDCPDDSFCDTDGRIHVCQSVQGCGSTYTPGAARFVRSVTGRQMQKRAVPEVNPAKFRLGSEDDSK